MKNLILLLTTIFFCLSIQAQKKETVTLTEHRNRLKAKEREKIKADLIKNGIYISSIRDCTHKYKQEFLLPNGYYKDISVEEKCYWFDLITIRNLYFEGFTDSDSHCGYFKRHIGRVMHQDIYRVIVTDNYFKISNHKPLHLRNRDCNNSYNALNITEALYDKTFSHMYIKELTGISQKILLKGLKVCDEVNCSNGYNFEKSNAELLFDKRPGATVNTFEYLYEWYSSN